MNIDKKKIDNDTRSKLSTVGKVARNKIDRRVMYDTEKRRLSTTDNLDSRVVSSR